MKLDVPKPLNSPAIENVVIEAQNDGIQDVPQPPDFGAPQPDPSARKKRRNEHQSIPAELVKEIVAAAQTIHKNHKARFLADPKLKDRSARLFRTLLPPQPRRPGRKPIASVTRAIRLLKRLKRAIPRHPAAATLGEDLPEGDSKLRELDSGRAVERAAPITR